MLGVLGKILGSDSVIKQGMKLIDDMHTSTEEEIAAKSKARIDLMNAYAPFKLAQRYLALMFGFTFLASYIIVLTMTIAGTGDPDAVTKVMEQFSINYAMMIILGFYFGAGALESFQNKKKGS
jgi:Na+-driven multidrug efflux pump